MNQSRRNFLKNTSLAAAGFSAIPFLSHARSSSPGEKIVVALIGANSMGFGDLTGAMNLPYVECGAICDIDQSVLDRRAAEIEKKQGKAPQKFTDFRKLLEQKDIDTVIIGTPDHWHCLITVLACQAGKDVYVEKPMANSIGECETMIRAARKYNRIVQVGMQQRSSPFWQDSRRLVQEGGIGQLRQVNVWCNFNYGIGAKKVPDSAVPKGVNYDMWLGPAPERTFNASRFHGNWRMFWDYGGGLMTDWGVHLLDMALWVKDIKAAPERVMAAGGNWAFPDHAHETFDTLTVNYQLPDYGITWQNIAGTQTGPYDKNYGLEYIGDDATLVINRESWKLIPQNGHEADGKFEVSRKNSGEAHALHMKNFLESVKSRKDPACPVEDAALVAQYAHMGNISLRSESALIWEEKNKNFGDHAAANQYLLPAYRKPWALPKI